MLAIDVAAACLFFAPFLYLLCKVPFFVTVMHPLFLMAIEFAAFLRVAPRLLVGQSDLS